MPWAIASGVFFFLPYMFDILLQYCQVLSYQKGFIELKGARKLPGELVNTVKPLKKYWTSLVFVMILPVTTPIGKTMTKLQPLTCHQYLEALSGNNNENILWENSCMKSETHVEFRRKESHFTNCYKTRNSVLASKPT